MSTQFPDVLILAGGFGTRLQSVVSDVPKPMAPVAGKPFLYWLLRWLKPQNPGQIILCTGYKHEIIESYFGDNFEGIPLCYSVEDTPLGTGGAIKKGFKLVKTNDVLVLNGDTMLKMNYSPFFEFHLQSNSTFSMALKVMKNPARYGTVVIENTTIKGFNEKNPDLEEGLINAGVYLLSKNIENHFPVVANFSFEKEILESKASELLISGFTTDAYFIDIGIPEDYQKANLEFDALFNN